MQFIEKNVGRKSVCLVGSWKHHFSWGKAEQAIPCWGLQSTGCHIWVLPRSTAFPSKEVKGQGELSCPKAWSSALLAHLALLQPGRPTETGVGADFPVRAMLMGVIGAAAAKHGASPALGQPSAASTRGVYPSPSSPNPPSHVCAHPTLCGDSSKRTR